MTPGYIHCATSGKHSTAQHSTAQHSTAQHSTVQPTQAAGTHTHANTHHAQVSVVAPHIRQVQDVSQLQLQRHGACGEHTA